MPLGRLPSGGWPTIGYGFNLSAWPLTKEECDYILQSRIFTITRGLYDRMGVFKNLSPMRQAVIINMAFNVGIGGLMKFHRMLTFLRTMDFNQAAKEIVASNAGRDPRTAKRYRELAELMVNG